VAVSSSHHLLVVGCWLVSLFYFHQFWMQKSFPVLILLILQVCWIAVSQPDLNRPGRSFSNFDYYQPTQEEIERALVISPPSYWGKDIFWGRKKEKVSLRIFALGGSNTALGEYVSLLKKDIRKLFSSDSYVLNGGVGGSPPHKRKYGFETSLPVERWPNIVIIEYAVNCAPLSGWDCVQALEGVIASINAKYVKKNLPPPQYLMFELFTLHTYYGSWYSYGPVQGLDPDRCDKLVVDNSAMLTNLSPPSDVGFNHAEVLAVHLGTFARFYRIPLLSARDALWPSFVRYYQTHLNCSLWPFTREGTVHLSKFGFQYLTEKVLTPFFVNRQKYFYKLENELKSKEKATKLEDMRKSEFADKQAKLFPLSVYQVKDVLSEWNSWGPKAENTLQKNILRGPGSSEFTFLPISPLKDDGGHICYRSQTASGVFRFLVPTPYLYFSDPTDRKSKKGSSKSGGPVLALSLEMVHSWNTSFIGDLSCQLYQSNDNAEKKPFETAAVQEKKEILGDNPIYSKPVLSVPKIIRGNKFPDQDHLQLHETVPRSTVLTSELRFGSYLLECKKLDPKVVCVTRIILSEI
jgi:hypothetical protein